MRPLLALLVCLATLLAPGWSQTQGPAAPTGQTGSPLADTLSPAKIPASAATSAAAADTSRPKSRADTVLVVKHRFNHREQLITGSVVMTCLALMMVVMNNYNPR